MNSRVSLEVFKRLPALWCVGVGVILLAVLVIFLIYGLFRGYWGYESL